MARQSAWVGVGSVGLSRNNFPRPVLGLERQQGLKISDGRPVTWAIVGEAALNLDGVRDFFSLTLSNILN
jgi:hypothetical protein